MQPPIVIHVNRSERMIDPNRVTDGDVRHSRSQRFVSVRAATDHADDADGLFLPLGLGQVDSAVGFGFFGERFDEDSIAEDLSNGHAQDLTLTRMERKPHKPEHVSGSIWKLGRGHRSIPFTGAWSGDDDPDLLQPGWWRGQRASIR